MLYILREKTKEENRFNAGSKARLDVDSILISMGASPVNCEFDFTEKRTALSKLGKLQYHFKTAKAWKEQLKSIPDCSTVVIQFPLRAHTVFLKSVIDAMKKRSIRTIAIIHDLDALRGSLYFGRNAHGFRLKLEEINALKEFDVIIAHNDKMKKALCERFGVNPAAVVSLGIFDYLIPPEIFERRQEPDYSKMDSVAVAGNLDYEKSGYVYKLPSRPTFELYGSNYKGDYADNVHYHGKFLPDELPVHMLGKYGLVWDGEDTSACTGIFGEYLKVNNPHKTSLYLACGVPVIIWDQAAIADFVETHQCGIVIGSLDRIPKVLEGITEEKYRELKRNAEEIGKKLREGYYTKRAIGISRRDSH